MIKFYKDFLFEISFRIFGVHTWCQQQFKFYHWLWNSFDFCLFTKSKRRLFVWFWDIKIRLQLQKKKKIKKRLQLHKNFKSDQNTWNVDIFGPPAKFWRWCMLIKLDLTYLILKCKYFFFSCLLVVFINLLIGLVWALNRLPIAIYYQYPVITREKILHKTINVKSIDSVFFISSAQTKKSIHKIKHYKNYMHATRSPIVGNTFQKSVRQYIDFYWYCLAFDLLIK